MLFNSKPFFGACLIRSTATTHYYGWSPRRLEWAKRTPTINSAAAVLEFASLTPTYANPLQPTRACV